MEVLKYPSVKHLTFNVNFLLKPLTLNKNKAKNDKSIDSGVNYQ